MIEKPSESTLRARILVSVVAYLPDREMLRSLVNAYAKQGAAVLVVDNSPAEDDRAWSYLEDLCATDSSIRLVRCGKNLGIAAALNLGIEATLREGFDHVLLSDQDSEPEPGMLSCLQEIHAKLSARDIRVGCVAPAYFDVTTGQTFSFQSHVPGRFFYRNVSSERASPWIEILTSITSGTLISRCALLEVGPMCEHLFIDHVDTEWCHRARKVGFKLYGTSLVHLTHHLGDNLLRVWLFGWRNCNEYSSTRLYYRLRNFVLLCKLPYISTRWKFRASFYWMLSVYGHLLFSSSRRENFWMIMRGLRDGLQGRTGPLE
ncbi:MAG: glycosyltransferase family 2 protein [Xanthomonadaceae bacterium]|nr:glycosyltransferase family 2 protein [Xanthomonadaceae bacterium]